MVHRLLFFILLVYAAGSLAVSIWLIRKYGASGTESLDSFIGMVAWLGSLLALTVTVWFKWAES